MSGALDTQAVTRWLAPRLAGFEGPLQATKFPSGQSNPTYLLRARSGDYVLRRKPPGALLKSAHAVEREYRVQHALAGSGVPVARMLALCEDDRVIGSSFYVMEYIRGAHYGDPTLPGLTPEARGKVYDEMNRVLATLHMLDPDRLGLSDFGPPGSYFERQITRWSRQYHASATHPLPAMDALIEALLHRLPPDDGQRTLVHGDYRIDNMLFAPKGAACRAVLDWELSTIGHPFADLAALIMQWQMPPGGEGRGLAGVDRAALGIPSDTAFIRAYCARRGLGGIADFGFYLGFCFFRMGAILQGVKRRALDGNASNPEQALRLGAYVPEFAAKGMSALNERTDITSAN